ADCNLRGGAETRQQAIAIGRLGREVDECLFGLLMLALVGQFDGPVEGPTGLGRLLGFNVLVTAPSSDRRNDENRGRYNVDRVLIPQLLELLATDLLVYFIIEFRHLR